MQEIYNLFSPVFLSIGPLNFYWYGLFYAISFYFGYRFIFSKIKDKISEDEFDKMFFGIAIFALIGGRLGHVFFYDFSYYSQNILEVFQVWKGGMASHGGIIGAIIGFLIFTKSSPDSLESGLKLRLLDLFAISGAFGFGLGRLGNFINGELYGKQIENLNSFTQFIGVNFGDEILRHPIQIYSSFANFLIFGILFFLLQKNFFNQEKSQSSKYSEGKIFSLFLIFFGIQRFFLEFLKEDFVGNNYFEILTTGQIFSVVLILVGIFLFFGKKFFGPREKILES